MFTPDTGGRRFGGLGGTRGGRGRIGWVDALRGCGVVSMVVYHFLFDLGYFFDLPLIPRDSGFWKAGHLSVAGVFFLCAGFSSGAGFRNSVPRSQVLRRTTLVGASALLVSLSTYLLFPERWIQFGILHALTLSGLILLALREHPRFCAAVGALVASICFTEGVAWPEADSVSPRLDYVPVLPWVSVSLFGRGVFALIDPLLGGKFQRGGNLLKCLEWLGRRSLPVYLVHQPILLGAIYLAEKTFRWD